MTEPVMTRTVDGGITTERWELPDGRLHRLDGPAVLIEHNHDGDLVSRSERWFKDGKLHRSDGPAEFERRRMLLPGDIDGDWYVAVESWWRDGEEHREDGPAWIQRNHRDGGVIRERWKQGGRLHRDGGAPAFISYHEGTTVPAQQVWYEDGKIHRDGSPAIVDWFDDGTVQSESRYRQGVILSTISFRRDGTRERELHCEDGDLHREGGAARTVYFEDGSAASEEWYQSGELHRADGPAAQEWYEGSDRPCRAVQYRHHGLLHRVDGAAFKAWRPDGSVAMEQWWHDGRRRGPDEPAVICRDETGTITYTEYWSGDQILRCEGELATYPTPLPSAVSEEIANVRAQANYLPAENKRIWHRTCLGLRDSPDICFFFMPRQQGDAISRLLRYFPCADELTERFHYHLNFALDSYPSVDEIIAAAVDWCEQLIDQAVHVELDENAKAIRSLLDRRAFDLAPRRVVFDRLHADYREGRSDEVLIPIRERIEDSLMDSPEWADCHATRVGRWMLKEACYQIATDYDLQCSLMTPMLAHNYGFDTYAHLTRLGGMIYITADTIMIGYPDPDHPGSRVRLADPGEESDRS